MPARRPRSRDRRSPIGAPVALAASLLSALAGCADTDPPALIPPVDDRYTIELSEVIPTVATVRWLEGCDHAERVFVEFAADDGAPQVAVARAEPDGSCAAVVVGMKPDRTYDLRLEELVDDTPLTVALGQVTTGSVPASLPEIEATVFDGARDTRGFLSTMLMTSPPAYVVLDQDGDYVWWHLPDDIELPPSYRAVPSVDGRGMVFQQPSLAPNYEGRQPIGKLSFDGTTFESWEGSERCGHDFVELPDGTLAIIVQHEIDTDWGPVIGDQLLELLPNGEGRQLWSVWDYVDYDPDAYPDGDPGATWSHANALDFEPAENAYYLSLCNMRTILRIDRDTGDETMVFGGPHSEYRDPEDSSEFTVRQHQFQVLPDGLLIHDNRDGGEPSRAVQYVLDDATGRAHAVWEYRADPPLYDFALGDVTRLQSGNTLVTWSTAGQIDEVSLDGELVWQLRIELGAALSYTTWTTELGSPHPAPGSP